MSKIRRGLNAVFNAVLKSGSVTITPEDVEAAKQAHQDRKDG